jgi:F-type H+-transporting ATPase subunit delta
MSSVSRSYAKALLETAQENGLKAADLDQIEAELNAFGSAMVTSGDLNVALSNPTISNAEKASIAEAVATKLGFSKLTTQFLTMVARKRRGSVLEEIAETFMAVRLESEGATLGAVVSADVLKKEDLEELATSFTRKLGKKVVFKAAVDPNLLAGLKVTVNGITYDGSLRSQLQTLRDRLVYGKPGTTH